MTPKRKENGKIASIVSLVFIHVLSRLSRRRIAKDIFSRANDRWMIYQMSDTETWWAISIAFIRCYGELYKTLHGRPSKDEKTKTRVDGPYTRDDEAKQSIFRPADAHAGNPIRRDRRGKQQEGSAQTRLSCVWVSANSTVVLKKQTKRIKNDGAVQITHDGGKLRRVIPEGRHLLQCIWKYNVLIIKDVGDFLYPT